MVDWNEDGLKDLLVGEESGYIRYYRNIGSPGNPSLTFEANLVAGASPINVGSNSYPWVDDWNEDGLKDLLVGASDGRIRLYFNVGTNANPVFNDFQYLILADGTEIDLTARSTPIVADLNGDGLKDLTSGNIEGYVYFFENSGTNPHPQLADPDTLKTGTITIRPGATTRAAPIDWNNDGLMDLMVGYDRARLMRCIQAEETAPAPTNDLTLTGPFTIPASGGTQQYLFDIGNPWGSGVNFDVWTDMKLPDESFFGPLILRPDVRLEPYASISRELSQVVPGTASNGYYYLYGYVGNYGSLQIYDQDYFYFLKSYTDGQLWFGDWDCEVWGSDAAGQTRIQVPDRIGLRAFPNPFNLMTTISYNLSEAGRVDLSVFNVDGRKVIALVDGFRDSGSHEVTWDASGLPSGAYLVAIDAGLSHQVHKVFLLK